MAIDESKARDLPIFRLAEKFSAILVHDRIRAGIERAGIDTLTFLKPEEYYHL